MTNSYDIREYYSIFINTTSSIARNFGARVVKNIGDSVVYYFPRTSDVSNGPAFRNALECCVNLNSAINVITAKLRQQYLPEMQYRISADYGKVEIATTKTSVQEDLFGSTINLCAKFNKLSAPGKILIGGDLYGILKSLPSVSKLYSFRSAGEYSVGIKYSYPLYNVYSKYRSSTVKGIKNLISLRPSKNSHSQKGMVPVTSNRKRIMLVDDDIDILFTFHTILSSEGILVDSYKDSRKALDHLAEVDPGYYDLVVLDIRMPNLNGLEFYRKLKVINGKIKVIFVSALDASEELCSVLSEFNPDNLLRKPLERYQLIAAVKRVLSDGTESAIITGR
jgi:CheY-like chemotaxis protein